jgi:ribose transport system substrate-binding protein
MLRIALTITIACLLIGLAAGCDRKPQSSDPDDSARRTRIAVIPKGTTHVFWRSVEAGARKAGQELDVQIIWKGPMKEDDRSEQIKVVQQFTAEGVDGIVLAPLDSKALAEHVRSATGRRIPVVIFDSALDGQPGVDFVSFVATDNFRGGQMAGEELARVLDGKGKVVLLRYAVGSASTEQREAGFLEVMKKHPGISIIVDNRYAGATVASAKDEAMKLVDRLKEADGVFCPNESSTLGMLGALRDNNLAGKIKFVGFDATPALVAALRKQEVVALIAQDPTRMGYEGVRTVVAHIRGEQVPVEVDTGVRLITLENLQTPEIKALLGE